ncbi:MAG: competence protein ComEA [Woeseiaceae bacterium]|jgi:competence protein ComEA
MKEREEYQMENIKRKILAALVILAAPAFAVAGPVNVNTADAETISAELQGVGITKAIAIVEYRKANGPFKSPDDLALVKGIGERTVELNREFILLQSSAKKSP